MIVRRRHRRGAALLVVVLTCLLVVSGIARAMTHNTIRCRRAARTELQMRQTELLLDAGILRAARQLNVDPEYHGESWQPGSAFDQFGQPRVEIRVSANPSDAPMRMIVVVASFSKTGADEVGSDASLTRRSHTFSVKPSTSSDAE